FRSDVAIPALFDLPASTASPVFAIAAGAMETASIASAPAAPTAPTRMARLDATGLMDSRRLDCGILVTSPRADATSAGIVWPDATSAVAPIPYRPGRRSARFALGPALGRSSAG